MKINNCRNFSFVEMSGKIENIFVVAFVKMKYSSENNDRYKNLITKFITINKEEILENVLAKIKQNDTVKDIFVYDNSKVVGWLTDTLIMRYLKFNNQNR